MAADKSTSNATPNLAEARGPERQERRISENYVFRERGDGGLEMVGDFDGLYRAEADPWGQSGGDARMGDYYRYSRANIIRLLAGLPARPRVLEVGCGLGQVCRQIADAGVAAGVAGADVSPVAIEKARGLHPDIQFLVADVTAPGFARTVGTWDVVILNQLLWYVLEGLPQVLVNAREVLKDDGWLLITNAFLREPQRYGAAIVDGFDGLIRYLAANTASRFRFVDARLHGDPAWRHEDGYVLMAAR